MSLYQPTTAAESTRRNEKRLNRLERRSNPNYRIALLEGRGVDNKVIDGDFRVNQREYVSGAALTPGLFTGYGHDRWRTGEYLNLIPNPSFETNTTGWAGTSVTFTRVTNFGVFGTCSASLVGTAVNDSHIQYTLVTVPGSTYTVSAYARLTAPLTGPEMSGARARAIFVFDGATSVTRGTSPQSPNVAGTTRLSVTFIATGTNSSIRLYHGQTGGTIWWDGVMVTEGDVLLPYVDGSQPGCRWTGAAHASTSGSRSAATSYTFTQTPSGCTITLNSGGLIQQVIDQANMPADEYTLSWEGTAEARVYEYTSKTLLSSGSASPITFTSDGTEDILVEFEAVGAARTLGKVNLLSGRAAYPFQPRLIGEEMALCERYYVGLAALELNVWNPYSGIALTGGGQTLSYTFASRMRRAPTVNNATNMGDWNAFTYYNSSASAPGNYFTQILPTAKGIFQGSYSAAFTGNGGVSLAAARSMGFNLNPIYLSAEF